MSVAALLPLSPLDIPVVEDSSIEFIHHWSAAVGRQEYNTNFQQSSNKFPKSKLRDTTWCASRNSSGNGLRRSETVDRDHDDVVRM